MTAQIVIRFGKENKGKNVVQNRGFLLMPFFSVVGKMDSFIHKDHSTYCKVFFGKECKRKKLVKKRGRKK